MGREKKRIGLHNRTALILLSCLLILGGCGSTEPAADPASEGKAVGYFITGESDGLVLGELDVDLGSYGSAQEAAEALAAALGTESDDPGLKAPLGEGSGYSSLKVDNTQAIVDFTDDYLSYDVIYRTLVMAAVTRTLTQINGIDTVSGTVNGSPMLDSSGIVIGALGADAYIDNAGIQINAEEKTQLTLYYANETGDELIKVNRLVVYSGNIPMDKLVVMQLLAGIQEGENGYPVMNPATKIINVTTQDGTCYVNLDSSFLTPPDNVTNDVALYSIVDSLVELGTVNKVQFLIDSDSDVMFRETVSLNTQFDRNLDLVSE